MSIKKTDLMPYEKFVQSRLRLITHGRKRIKGTFRDVKTKEIFKKDNFDCIVIGKGTAEESYKAALLYNNYVKEDGENDRAYVHAEWDNTINQ